jgi:hypothetical protein
MRSHKAANSQIKIENSLYNVVKMNEYSVLSRSKKIFLLFTCAESL